jgi:Arc/MetJ-type ribon-helix-helix transcriptional regulator
MNQTYKQKTRSRNLWFERFMAVFLIANLILVLFDISYISKRSFYFFHLRYQDVPLLTNLYDRVKGIQPNRQTQKYLQIADELVDRLDRGEPISSPEIEKKFKQIRNLSINIINTDPFNSANLSGYLEKTKNRMREHIGVESAKEAFEIFWSANYLATRDLKTEINFHQQDIRSLIAVNYFRPLDETGTLVDRFWQIDIWFSLLFNIEFFIRTLIISIRQKIKWFDAMLWRWYDIFLLIPFWRFLRVITVTIRLNQARLISLDSIKKQASKGFVYTIADELTEVVVTHVIDRLQDSIRQGDITNFLTHQTSKTYIDLNDKNETAEIAKLIARDLVHKILPRIRPELETILQYSIQKFLKQTPGYQGLQMLPGIGNLQANLTEQVVKHIYQSASEFLHSLLEEDKVFEELLENLIANFNKSIASEIQNRQSLVKIESLLVELLQEIKINYVEPISEKNISEVWQETKIVPKSKSRSQF